MGVEALDPRTCALLVVDMQNAFCHPEGTLGKSGVELGEIRATIPRIRRLATGCRDAEVPVVWTRQEHLEGDARRTGKRLAAHTAKRIQVAALAGSWDAELVEGLAELADNPQLVVRKHRYGCFYETRLDLLLGMLDVDTLLIAGATANACVDTTIREAYLRDYDVLAVDDCIGAIDERWGAVAREVWAQYLCEFADSGEVLEWLDKNRDGVRELGHLLLQVEDLERAERFYVDLLGFKIRKRESFRDGRPLIVTEQGLGLTDGRPPGLGPVEHVAFRVGGVRELAARAKSAGVEILREPGPGAYGISVYLTDPDGNQIELFEPGAEMSNGTRG